MKLGVSSRSQMMQNHRNRSRRIPLDSEDSNSSEREQRRAQEPKRDRGDRVSSKGQLPTPGELWQDQAKAVKVPEKSRQKPKSQTPKDEVDDPLVAMGRLVKNVWKKVASPQMQIPSYTHSAIEHIRENSIDSEKKSSETIRQSEDERLGRHSREDSLTIMEEEDDDVEEAPRQSTFSSKPFKPIPVRRSTEPADMTAARKNSKAVS